MGRLDGKVALITGGGSGMGMVASKLFATEGARVVLTDVADDAGEAVAKQIEAAGGRAAYVHADVSKEADARSMVEAAVERFGGLHVLYNNAGVMLPDDGSVDATDESVWDRTLAINVKGVAFGCKFGIPAMIDSGGGSIINVASFVAWLGAATSQTAYTASKGAVLSMTREIAVEYARRGIPIEFSKGEFGKGQHEINVTYADALTTSDYHVLYKHGVKEICAANGVAATFMAKWTMAEAGSSCHMHSSVWNADGTESLMWDGSATQHLSETVRHYLGGLMESARELSWMFAPFVNSYKRYQLGSWAPTAIVWSRDNRTCGFRTVGEHKGFRVEMRIPGADVNPYLGYAATIAAGLNGIANKIEPPEMFRGNAYEAKDVPRVPTSLHEAIETFKDSKVAREAFGDFVFEHLLNTAVQEQIIFDNTTVTDWELSRYFERG